MTLTSLTSQQLSLYLPLLISYAVIVGLFYKNRRDLKRLRSEANEGVRKTSTGVSNLSQEIQGIRESVRQIEEYPVAAPIGKSINLSRRAQVLRMHRRGETVPCIAAALRTPANEVELLLKLHQLLNN
jgi:hypothetical protein